MRKIPSKLFEELSNIVNALDNEDYAVAEDIVERLLEEYPQRLEPLEALFDYCIAINRFISFLEPGERALKRYPMMGFLYSGLTLAYLEAGYPFSAYRMADLYSTREKTSELSSYIQTIKDNLAKELQELVKSSVLPDASWDVHSRMEHVRFLYETGQFERTIKEGKKLLKKQPDCIPVYNNLSKAYWERGNINQALSTAEKAVSMEEDNIHALVNVIRLRILSGDAEEHIEDYITALQSSEKPAWKKPRKLVEAYALLGCDDEVLNVIEQHYGLELTDPKRNRRTKQSPPDACDDPFIYHFAAVALHRLGDKERPELLWKKGLNIDPEFSLIQLNLEDYRKSEEEKNGPWYYPLRGYLPQVAMDILEKALTENKEHEIVEAAHTIYTKYPFVIHIIPILLDRGDPLGRFFALLLLDNDNVFNRYKAELHQFAFSRKGEDQLRHRAVRLLQEKGEVRTKDVEMYVGGKRMTVNTYNFRIIREQTDHIPNSEAEKLHNKGYYALQEGRYKEAEKALRKAIELEPEAPSIWNNLAAALEHQGKVQEAHAIMHDIQVRFPDYTFGTIMKAQELANSGQTDEAREILDPILERDELHISEYTALCVAEIGYAIKEKQLDVARRWLDMLEEVEPDHPAIQRYSILKKWPF